MLHSDFDKDGLCDECNYEMGDCHLIRYSVHETGHSVIILCGCCNAPAVEEAHIDNDVNDFILNSEEYKNLPPNTNLYE